MNNTFHKAFVATALLALGFSAAPASADAAADKVTGYVEMARSVFGGEKTAGDVIAEKIANADQGAVGELAAALSAAEVAKDDPAVADALAGIVSAVNDAAGDDAFDFASRAAATVAAVTGLDIAGSLSDEAFADAANDPDSVLDATEKADLKDLYEKVLAALKGAGYDMKGDDDKVAVDGKTKKNKGKKGKGKGGDAAAAAAAAAGADGSDAKAGGSDAKSGDGSGSDGATSGGGEEAVIYDDDENLGDPLDQTFDPVPPAIDPNDPKAPYGPHEYHPTPTTLSGMNQPILTPVVPTTPKPTKPSPTPVGLR